MADIDRVELLIGLSNNMRSENAEWNRQIRAEGAMRARKVNELMNLFEKEYGALAAERDWLSQYLPKQVQQLPEQPMPKAATQGPRT